jgi:hypothetical protein
MRWFKVVGLLILVLAVVAGCGGGGGGSAANPFTGTWAGTATVPDSDTVTLQMTVNENGTLAGVEDAGTADACSFTGTLSSSGKFTLTDTDGVKITGKLSMQAGHLVGTCTATMGDIQLNNIGVDLIRK